MTGYKYYYQQDDHTLKNSKVVAVDVLYRHTSGYIEVFELVYEDATRVRLGSNTCWDNSYTSWDRSQTLSSDQTFAGFSGRYSGENIEMLHVVALGPA